MLKTVGWTALIVTNPDPEPSLWQAHGLETPLNPLRILVGFAAVQRLNGYIVAIGSRITVKFEEQLTDSLIYYPGFIRLTRCR
jgi:hypothetical protein